MADHLVAFLLATSSSKGANVIFSWPPAPQSQPRLRRPRTSPQLDNPTRGMSYDSAPVSPQDVYWQHPETRSGDHSPSFPRSGPNSRTNSFAEENRPVPQSQYNDIFGYAPEILGNILCPTSTACFQKFELVVDDLAFIGHPVCTDGDGLWRAKGNSSNKAKYESRGRDVKHPHSAHRNEPDNKDHEQPLPKAASWLGAFNFCAVIDLPDPSFTSDNVSKYFSVIYEQLVFTVTAVLFQEQVSSNFVEAECDILGSLRDSCISKGDSFNNYVDESLNACSLANSIRVLYEALSSQNIAYMTINNLPLELQLPPHLDGFFQCDEETEISSSVLQSHRSDDLLWGGELAHGWNLPQLAPWKSLLLLDGPLIEEALSSLRNPQPNSEEQVLVDGLVRFLEEASIGVSLADMADLLDWDLESQIYVAVRWLVLHRRAKLCDMIHPGLKTVFALPRRFPSPLPELAQQFAVDFDNTTLPPLTHILSAVSTASSKHFFDAVVYNKELLKIYHEAVVWMLKRDLLVVLHLHIRLVATKELKARVRSSRAFSPNGQHDGRTESFQHSRWASASPHNRRIGHRRHSTGRDSFAWGQSGFSGEPVSFDDELRDEEENYQDEENKDNDVFSSIIYDPSRATPYERRLIDAMSEGKDSKIVKLFEKINQYFDGKTTDDEILFRAEIPRRQLREVVQQYAEYIQTFLHPA